MTKKEDFYAGFKQKLLKMLGAILAFYILKAPIVNMMYHYGVQIQLLGLFDYLVDLLITVLVILFVVFVLMFFLRRIIG